MRYFRFIITILLVGLLSNFVWAASRDVGSSNDPAFKMKLMLRQVMAEKEAINAKNTKLEVEIKKLKDEKKAKEKKLKNANKKLEKSSERGKQLTEKLKESFKMIRTFRQENQELKSGLQVMTVHRNNAQSNLNQCMKMNVNLYAAGQEVLDRYEKEVSSSVDPIFKLKSVEIETAVQEYRFKMEDLAIPESKIRETMNNSAIAKTENHDETVSATAGE